MTEPTEDFFRELRETAEDDRRRETDTQELPAFSMSDLVFGEDIK